MCGKSALMKYLAKKVGECIDQLKVILAVISNFDGFILEKS